MVKEKIKQEEELRRRAFREIFSNKYFISGNCLNCGKEYSYCTNKKPTNFFRDCYCSDKCWKEWLRYKKKIKKEVNHYQIYKDKEFYYIVINGNYDTKRDFKGKTWMKKSEQNKQREEDNSKKVLNWKLPILAEKSNIPSGTIKIIDRISTFLYDDKHKFIDWRDLKEISP